MIDKTSRVAWALLATSALASPAFAQTGVNDTPPSPQEQVATDGREEDPTEIVVTATKREENLQDVPVSIQAIGTRRLDQLNISNFEDYTKQLPSVSFQTLQPGSTTVYMRGVATGGDGNHSGSFPSVGTYLDEQPVTTIGGTLDIHIYDIARIESLAGPQGTLYGASSQAGTIRIITNKPEIGQFNGRVDGEINKIAGGDWGGSLEGMVNVPINDRMAARFVAFYQRDGGFVDNVFGSRTYCGDPVLDGEGEVVGCVRNGISVDNEEFVEKNFNDYRVYGGRAALKIDLDDNWTVTPTIMHQNGKVDGYYGVDPDLGGLRIDRFRDEISKDKWTQAALLIEGKVFDFDVTYSGAYLKRPTYSLTDYTDYADAYDAAYEGVGGLANYFYYQDAAGNTIDPRQYIIGTNDFRKLSQEIRVASPQDKPFRVIAGAFYQVQKNDIFQDYKIDNLAPDLSVNGYPGSLWVTKQKRKDKDYALFGEASFDITPQVTLTGGGRLFKFDNTLFGFAGFGVNPNYDPDDPDSPPRNAAGGSSGVYRCLTVNGEAYLDDFGAPFAPGGLAGTPCTNVGTFRDGKVVPRRSKGNGFIHRLNAQYKPIEDVMFYATWSRGFRPGGINRQPLAPAYDPDYLTNYELGWKTSFGRLRWNGAIYRQRWEKFQFSFLGLNSLTVIQNGRDAIINGIETDVNYVAGGLTLNAAAAYTDAKTDGNICNFAEGNSDCSGLDDQGDPDFVVTPSGSRLPVTPKWKGSVTARYAWPMWTGRAHVQGAMSFQSGARADIRRNVGDGENPLDPATYLGRIKGRTVFDIYAGYDWSTYNAELFVSNLFNEDIELTRGVVCSICTNTLITPGRPRTIGVRLGTKF
ncbi:TonB-dependent receptor [Sphingomonas arenae]|uniref:TonB-dependent receptor n=1 Tax=Sphingomonas arenae TaxID=2812555 RepID=UPI00196705A7|nr:TonB-dependent receptor [Sphingomonas arenae]